MGRCATHCPPASSADSIPGPGTVFVALVVIGYRFGRWAVPLAVAGLIHAGRWATGAPMLGRRPRRYARRVHAAGRLALVAVAAAALADWRLTALAVGAAAAAAGGAALVARDRRRIGARQGRQMTARRVRVRVGAPVRPRPAAAVTSGTATPWSTSTTRAASSAGGGAR